MAKRINTLKDYINVLSDFQFSINIEYDLFSDQKIRNYIPTASAVSIIEDLILSTATKSTDRARIFVGAYGKGKSHLALMLLALLSRKDKSLYSDLLSMICQTKPELCNYINNYQESNQKMLPVVIQGSSVGIRQALLLGLKKALQVADLGEIMPNTYYGAAINTIENWKNNYCDTFEKFKGLIPCSVQEFESELSNFNTKYYDNFVEIYPLLTSGSEFNPVDGIDIIELYADVNNKIQKYGYTGIFVIYDEFSKFLSGNLKNATADEIEILQYFAEACNRSGSKQMHILLISHQSILSYVDKLSKAKINAWKAVSQRFKTIELNTSAEQMYELTSHVIKKDGKWFKDFLAQESVSDIFEQVFNKWRGKRLFAELTEQQYKNLIYGCYPLEPITTFMLPQISEKIAQNERTLFTFLSAEGQRFTLPYYLNNTELKGVPFVTPDCIYDYFETLFKTDSYERLTHKYWKIATSAINKIEAGHDLEKQMVKTLALIYIIDRFEILEPTVDTLIAVYSGSINDTQLIIPALTYLTDNGIIRKLEGKDYLKIIEYTGKNVNSLIDETVEKRTSVVKVEEILNQFAGNRVIYPNAYNDDNEIVRYFDFRFIDATKITKGLSEDYFLSEVRGDGIVYAIISNGDQIKYVIETIKEIKNNRIVFILPNEMSDALNSVRRYDAIKYLMDIHKEDDILVEELNSSLKALEEVMGFYVDSFLHPELNLSQYFIGGISKKINRRSALSKALSEICAEEFRLCPIINNELINKNILTGTAASNRAKVVNGLLSNELRADLGLLGSGQDVNFMRSTLCYTGILVATEEGASINLCPQDNNLANVLSIIKEFIVSTSYEGKKNIGELYEILTSPTYHIGLKRGVIPIYFAAVLHYYKKYCVILRNAKELEIDAKLLEAINEDPESYDLYLENWDDVKDNYILSLENIYSRYIVLAEKEFNNFSFIVNAMQRWYMQLPKYVKDIKNIYMGNCKSEPCPQYICKFLAALRNPEINARDFLFNKLLWVFEEKEFSSKLGDYVARAKTQIDKLKQNLLDELKNDLSKLFSKGKKNEKASLSSIIKDWAGLLSDDVISHMYNGSTNSMLSLCLSVTPDENKFIEDLARATTGLRIDDWSEITVEAFVKAVEDFVITIDSYKENISNSNEATYGSYKITFTDDTGKEIYRTFDKAEYSKEAKLMYEDAAAMIEEYGEALSVNEKRQVLIDIINKLLG